MGLFSRNKSKQKPHTQHFNRLRFLADGMGLEEVRIAQTLKFLGGKAPSVFVPGIVPSISKTARFHYLYADMKKRSPESGDQAN